MKILIVEDDNYKLERIREFSESVLGKLEVDTSSNLRDAKLAVNSRSYDLIYVDMAIPSHPTTAGQGAPVSFSTGGLAVIMELAEIGRSDPCIIITQYPDIEISGQYIHISLVKDKLPDLLECEVAACILYETDSMAWKEELRRALEEMFL